MEMQIIHQDIFGNLAAIAVLFKMSPEDNSFLNEIGFGVYNPLFAMRIRNYQTIELKSSKKFNLAKVTKFYKILVFKSY